MNEFKYWTDFKRNPFTWIVGEPEIGEETWIGPFTVIDASGGLKIGKSCSISAGVHIYTHEMSEPGTGKKSNIIRKPVEIGANVYLGANSIIMMGTIIEDGAVIGAGSVVTKHSHIRKDEVWIGVPARKTQTDKVSEQIF